MKFILKDEGSAGTYLQGYVNTSYQSLVDTFGEPNSDGDEYKTDAEWVIHFEDGVVATIYNYKDGKNYNGPSGLDVEDITYWHIGGKVSDALSHVKAALKEKPSKLFMIDVKDFGFFMLNTNASPDVVKAEMSQNPEFREDPGAFVNHLIDKGYKAEHMYADEVIEID